ncbi:MAG: zf-HC2 domain-containing protein [Actinomycetota bacterium]|nr:zf-HC2 domain-containing protein [Actinomycetota bacterium]
MISVVSCQQCRELAAELALNVLTGRERVGVLAHLEACAGCRDTVSALTDTADRLVELLPDAEPPVGFEHRVMNAWHHHRGVRGGAGCP